MDKFLLAPRSIGYFSLLLMSGMISAYLFVVQKKLADKDQQNSMRLMGGVFSMVGILALLFFMQVSLYNEWGLIALYFQALALALLLLVMLQFAYHFPETVPFPKIEGKIILGVSSLYAGYELYLVILRLGVHQAGTMRYRPEYADYPHIFLLVWLLLVFVRRMVQASRQVEKGGFFKHLFHPQGRAAKSVRSLLNLVLIALGLGLLDHVIYFYLVASAMLEVVFFFGFLAVPSIFILIYMNNFPELINLRHRLTAMAVATNIVTLSIVAWTLQYPYSSPDMYSELDLAGKSIRFSASASGGYQVSPGNLAFDPVIGEQVSSNQAEINLPFSFPFYGEAYTSFFTDHSGIITFGEIMPGLGLENRYGPVPAIFALYYPAAYVSDIDVMPDDAGVFYRQDRDRVLLTWSYFPELVDETARSTYQLVLFPDGSFEIIFKDIDADPARILSNKYVFCWFSGATPGNQVGTPDVLAKLPKGNLSLDSGEGLVVDYKYQILKTQHPIISAFIPAIFLSSLAIMIFFPLSMEKSVLQPIGELLAKVEKVKGGDYAIKMDPAYSDELGTIAASFDSVVAELDSAGDRQSLDDQTFSRIFEHSPSAVMIVDNGFRIVYVNKVFTDMTGFSKEEVVGNTPNIMTSGKTLMEVYRQLWQTILDGEVWRGEILNQRKGGKEYWANVVVAPVKNQEQKNSHYVWMIEDVTERKQAEEALVELSITDPLVGIYNRRQLFVLGENAVNQALRYNTRLSILMLDIDHFKKINDTYGHPVGDQVLIALSDSIKAHIRTADIFGRYGGEEFMVILPNTDLSGAMTSAENLRKEIEAQSIMTSKGEIAITVSVGVCDLQPSRADFDEVLIGADMALYNAKNNGRNRVSVYSGVEAMPWELEGQGEKEAY